MYLIQYKRRWVIKANANPSNPVGKRVHFVSTFLQVTWQVMWPQGAAIFRRHLGLIALKKHNTSPEWKIIFLNPDGNEIMDIPSFLFFCTTHWKIIISFRLLRMNLLLLRMGKCRHHLISWDLTWMKIAVWNYLQTKSVIISAIRFAVFINCISIEITIQLNS